MAPVRSRMFFYITLPHLRRAIAVVVMMETIFLLSIFAEIYTTTGGRPGHRDDRPVVPDLRARACSSSTSASRRRAAFSPSSWRISSRSSSCGCSRRT